VRVLARKLTVGSIAALLTLFGVVVTAPAAGAAGTQVFVSKDGSDSATCGRANDPCLTIGKAVDNAHDGDRVFVLPGTYAEMVTVHKKVSLFGADATIDASNQNNGILLQGPGASGSKVSFFTVENAIGEGILATLVDHVTIEFNTVMNNDRGATVTNTYPECQPQGEIPGDCGEGLHIQATTNSRVAFNDVHDNAGGILITDDMATTHGNEIEFNNVQNNKPDCGITVPGHTPGLGVFDNTISFNDVEGNGEGGVLLAAAAPGAGSHDNRITHNFIAQNGFAAVTLHSHTPNQNINNNVIEHNIIETNNIGGDPDAGVMKTTGVLIFVADPSVTVHGTQIRHNIIEDNHFGIWLTHGHVDAGGISHNVFSNVAIDIQN
jgi:nitrous oxidase accessory protein NosD